MILFISIFSYEARDCKELFLVIWEYTVGRVACQTITVCFYLTLRCNVYSSFFFFLTEE